MILACLMRIFIKERRYRFFNKQGIEVQGARRGIFKSNKPAFAGLRRIDSLNIEISGEKYRLDKWLV
jgi:hypothetical protein